MGELADSKEKIERAVNVSSPPVSLLSSQLEMTKNREEFNALSVAVVRESSKSTHELSNPITEPDGTKRQLELLKALRLVAALNSLNQCGDIYHSTFIVRLSKGGLQPIQSNAWSVVQSILNDSFFQALESPDPSLIILIIPEQYAKRLDAAIITNEHGILIVNKERLYELSGNSINIIQHPYEKTLELLQKASSAEIKDLPGILKLSTPSKSLNNVEEDRLTHARYLLPHEFEKLAEQRCYKAIAEIINSRSEEILAFALETDRYSFRSFITSYNNKIASSSHISFLSPSKITHYLGATTLIRRNPNYYQEKVSQVIASSAKAEEKATLLCKLINLACSKDS